MRFVAVPEGSRIVKLGGLVVRGQCLNRRLAVNATEAFASAFGPFVNFIQHASRGIAKLGDSFAHSTSDLRKVFGGKKNNRQSKNQNYLAAAEIEKCENRNTDADCLHTSFLAFQGNGGKCARHGCDAGGRAGEKRRRGGALQNLAEVRECNVVGTAFWSAPPLWRFSARRPQTSETVTPHPCVIPDCVIPDLTQFNSFRQSPSHNSNGYT